MSIHRGVNIIRTGLVRQYDFANTKSYESGIYVKNIKDSVLSPILNTTNPVAWSLGSTFAFFSGLSPTTIHFKDAVGASYLGFTLLNKKVYKWTTYEVSLVLEVISGSIRLFMGSANGGYPEGARFDYGVGTHIINKKVFGVTDLYSHEAYDLQFSVSTATLNGEARISELVVRERLYDLTRINSPTFTNLYKGILSFDGVNDHISMVNYTFELYHTISLWIDLTNVVNTKYFFGNIDNTNGIRYNGSSFLVYLGDSGYVELNWSKINEFVNLVIIRSTANLYSFYINGEYIGQSNSNTSSDLIIAYIGRRSDGLYFNGKIGNIMTYDRSLSTDEIEQNYLAFKSRFE